MPRSRTAMAADRDVVIDLGLMPGEPLVPGARTRGPGGPWLIATVVVLVALACVGDLPVRGTPRLASVARLDLGDLGYQGTTRYGVDGGLLYVVGQPPFAAAMRTFRLADGTPAWQPNPYLVPVGRDGPVMLLESVYCAGGVPTEVVAVDAASGAVLWRRPGRIRAAWPGFVLVAPQPALIGCAQPGSPAMLPAATVRRTAGRSGAPADPGPGVDPGPGADPGPGVDRNPDGNRDPGAVPYPGPDARAGAPVTGLVVATATGGVAWSVEFADDVLPAPGVDGSGRPVLLAMDTAGHWIRRDLRTGAADPGVTAPVWPPGSRRRGMTVITVLPDAVVTVIDPGDAPAVAGHDVATLAPRWLRVLRPDPGRPAAPLRQVACGVLLCLGNAGETVRLDATTGTVRWSTYAAGGFRALGSRWLLGTPAPLASSRTLLVDARSGRIAWLLVPWVPVGERGLASGAGGSRALVYRHGAGRTWFGWIDPEHGVTVPRVVGYVPGDKEECVSQGRYLACRAEDGALQLWRLPG